MCCKMQARVELKHLSQKFIFQKFFSIILSKAVLLKLIGDDSLTDWSELDFSHDVSGSIKFNGWMLSQHGGPCYPGAEYSIIIGRSQ